MTELKAMVSMEHYVFLFSSVRQMLPSDKASDIALALCAGQSPLHVPRPSFLLVKICVVFSFFLLNKSTLPPNWNNWLDGYVINTKKLLAFRGAQMINFLSQMRKRLLKNWLVVYPYMEKHCRIIKEKKNFLCQTRLTVFLLLLIIQKCLRGKVWLRKVANSREGFWDE